MRCKSLTCGAFVYWKRHDVTPSEFVITQCLRSKISIAPQYYHIKKEAASILTQPLFIVVFNLDSRQRLWFVINPCY